MPECSHTGCRVQIHQGDVFCPEHEPPMNAARIMVATEISILTTNSERRKQMPMARGLLDYFPAALAEVARVSYIGSEKHNPGEELHHSRGKSMDHADCIIRHLAERGRFDELALTDGRKFQVRHSAYAAWRALALLQEELENAGECAMAPGARAP